MVLNYIWVAFFGIAFPVSYTHLQMQVDAETGTEGSGKQTAARSGTHQSKGIQVELYAACRRAFVYHDVYPVVLHGGIKILLHYGTEPMDFVDEEHVVRLQRSQDTGQIARLVQYRAGRDLETHAQFVGYDVAQRGLPQSRRTVQQSMVAVSYTHLEQEKNPAKVLQI